MATISWGSPKAPAAPASVWMSPWFPPAPLLQLVAASPGAAAAPAAPVSVLGSSGLLRSLANHGEKRAEEPEGRRRLSLPAALQPLRMPQRRLGCDPNPRDGDGGGSLGPARAWQLRGSSRGGNVGVPGECLAPALPSASVVLMQPDAGQAPRKPVIHRSSGLSKENLGGGHRNPCSQGLLSSSPVPGVPRGQAGRAPVLPAAWSGPSRERGTGNGPGPVTAAALHGPERSPESPGPGSSGLGWGPAPGPPPAPGCGRLAARRGSGFPG